LVRAQVSDEEKPKRATAVHETAADESPTPQPKSSKAKPKKTPSPTPKAKKKTTAKKSAGDEDSSPTPTPKGKKAAKAISAKKAGTKGKRSTKSEEAGEAGTSSPSPSQTPVARAASPAPRAAASPTAPPPPTPVAPSTTAGLPPPNEEPAQLTIEKTGTEKRAGFWYRFFHGSGGGGGSGAGNRYLTRAVRAEIDRAGADRRNPRWQFIVVHNSGTRQGNARVFDYYHKHVRHMQNGLAYHFVIGNGTSTGNGQIEVGDRWRRQINGGHVHSDYMNNISLGICLVGDFNHSQPTSAQLQSCEELIRYLRQRCGKIGDHYMAVKPHREVNPPRWATDCPGDAFPYSWFRRFQE
jgi:hypothetical protein